jgi:hypothetical protein
MTTEGSSDEKGTRCTDQWSTLKSRKQEKGPIMLFDDQILQPHGAGAIAVIIITDIPDDIGINSNYVELLTQAAGHQLAYVEHSPRIETDGEGIIQHAVKDARKHPQRSRDAQTMAAMYRTICKVGYLNPKLARVHTSAHPEKHGRSPSEFNSKKARIYGTDLFADIGDVRSAQAKVKWATQEGLKYNIMPEHILYVTAQEVLEGLYEPGEFYWKNNEGGV